MLGHLPALRGVEKSQEAMSTPHSSNPVLKSKSGGLYMELPKGVLLVLRYCSMNECCPRKTPLRWRDCPQKACGRGAAMSTRSDAKASTPQHNFKN